MPLKFVDNYLKAICFNINLIKPSLMFKKSKMLLKLENTVYII